MRSLIAFVVLFAACGNVTMDGAATGGAAGSLSPDDNGSGGAAGAPGGRAGGGAAAPGGAGGTAPVCVSNNQNGFAFNGTCEGGGPASKGCHASCELDGAHYVGCVDPSTAGPLAYYSYASCSDCPAATAP